jgi:hypothetical protein
MIVCIPRVAMKGGTFRIDTTTPLIPPKNPMITITMISATGHGISGIHGSIRAE